MGMNLAVLPPDCLAHVLSYGSPIDASSVSLVSASLRVSADSDNVWETFLPGDVQQILSRLVNSLVYSSSKKELFSRLCTAHFIDGGKKMFSLDKTTGKKQYIMGARELKIKWANNPLYWTWKPYSGSRFGEVVELRVICWLEIEVELNTRYLSSDTMYSAYLIVKLADRAYGLDTLPSEISVETSNGQWRSRVYLRRWTRKIINNNIQRKTINHDDGEEGITKEREDGWLEIWLGEFYSAGGEGEHVKIGLKETTGEHLKAGLIVEGVDLRPVPFKKNHRF